MLVAARNLLQHWLSWMASLPPVPPIPGLSTSHGTPLDTFTSWLEAHPEEYSHFILEAATLCSTGSIPPHELVVFKLYQTQEDGTRRYYFIVADRVTFPESSAKGAPRTPDVDEPINNITESVPMNSTPNTSPNGRPHRNTHLSRTPSISDSWDSLQKPSGTADDCVRQWAPHPRDYNQNWWKGAYGSSCNPTAERRAIFDFDATRNHMTEPLSLIDVVLALRSVSEVAPIYSFRMHNCWWLARCSLLLLFLRQRQISLPPTLRAVTENDYFVRAPTTNIPYPDSLNEQVIRADTATAEVNYLTLVCMVPRPA